MTGECPLESPLGLALRGGVLCPTLEGEIEIVLGLRSYRSKSTRVWSKVRSDQDTIKIRMFNS